MIDYDRLSMIIIDHYDIYMYIHIKNTLLPPSESSLLKLRTKQFILEHIDEEWGAQRMCSAQPDVSSTCSAQPVRVTV